MVQLLIKPALCGGNVMVLAPAIDVSVLSSLIFLSFYLLTLCNSKRQIPHKPSAVRAAEGVAGRTTLKSLCAVRGGQLSGIVLTQYDQRLLSHFRTVVGVVPHAGRLVPSSLASIALYRLYL